MKCRIAVGGCLAVALLLTGVALAESLKSGPQVGDTPVPFNPLHVTGKLAGQKLCLV